MTLEIASLTDAMVGTSCVCKALTVGPVEEEEAGFATHSASVGTPRIQLCRMQQA